MADTGEDDEFDMRTRAERLRDGIRAYWVQIALGAVAGLSLLALGLSSYALTEARRDMLRVSTDIAQLKVSLDLFARQIQGAGPGGQSLVDLSNRLLILEQAWRDGAQNMGGSPPSGAPPAAGGGNAEGAGVASSPLDECIPAGTRFLAMPADSYVVCGTDARVVVATVGSGNVVLSDGTTIIAGGSGVLPGTQCMIGVLSAESDGVAGFAELRITC